MNSLLDGETEASWQLYLSFPSNFDFHVIVLLNFRSLVSLHSFSSSFVSLISVFLSYYRSCSLFPPETPSFTLFLFRFLIYLLFFPLLVFPFPFIPFFLSIYPSFFPFNSGLHLLNCPPCSSFFVSLLSLSSSFFYIPFLSSLFLSLFLSS